MYILRKIDPILKKLRELTNTTSDVEMCSALGLNYATLDGWKLKDSVPARRLLEYADKFNVSVDTLKSNVLLNSDSNLEIHDGYWIKKLNQKVGAGTSVDITEVDVIDEDDKFFVPATFFKTIMKNEKLRMAQVDGYSMVPMLHPDNWVIFEKTKEFKGDGLYVIMYNDNLMVKILQKTPRGNLYIKSTNKDYESFELDENTCGSCQIIGKVIKCII